MRLAIAVLLGAALAVALPAPAAAHPLGNFTVNRYSRLEIDPDRVMLRYVLDLAEIPTLQELAWAGIEGTPGPSERDALLRRFAPQLRDGARLTVAGERARWSERSGALELVPGQAGLSTLRISLTFVTAARIADGTPLDYRDTNFADRAGWREVVLRPGPGVRLDDATVTSADLSDELRSYPSDPAQPPLAVSSGSARVRLVAGVAPAQGSGAAGVASRFGVEATPDAITDLLRASSGGDLAATLLALLAAALIGGAHAVTPGHGKTVMAAYLVGSRGTPRQALALGGVVALSHTVGVLGLGLVVLGASSLLAPERMYPYLSALSALIVLGIGVWLVVGLLRRADDHAHAHGHDHDRHDHEHFHAGSHGHHHGTGGVVGWRALVALGVSGGLIPSASALLLLLAGVSLRRPDLGVLLIVAFGAGMAAVLVGTGLALIGAGRLAARHLGGRPAARRIGALLPAVTAAVVLLVGAGLSVQAGQQLLATLF